MASQSMTPIEKMSARASTVPVICSGAMYAGLPFSTPARVSTTESRALAMPKSTSLIVPSNVRKTFWGVASR